MYTIETLLHLGNPTQEQSNILQHMINYGYKKCVLLRNGARRYFRK